MEELRDSLQYLGFDCRDFHDISYFPCIRYKERKFGCNRSIYKGTSLGKPRTFSPVSRLPLKEFHWNFIPALQKCKFCWNRSILRALYLAKKYLFACIWVSIGGIFFWNFIPRTVHAFATNDAIFVPTGH